MCPHKQSESERASDFRLSVYLPIYLELSLCVKHVLHLHLHLSIYLSLYLYVVYINMQVPPARQRRVRGVRDSHSIYNTPHIPYMYTYMNTCVRKTKSSWKSWQIRDRIPYICMHIRTYTYVYTSCPTCKTKKRSCNTRPHSAYIRICVCVYTFTAAPLARRGRVRGIRQPRERLEFQCNVP